MSDDENLTTDNQPIVDEPKTQENKMQSEILTFMKGMKEGFDGFAERIDNIEKKVLLSEEKQSANEELNTLKAQSDAMSAALKEMQEKSDTNHVNKIEEFDDTFGGNAANLTDTEKNAQKIDFVLRQLNGGQ